MWKCYNCNNGMIKIRSVTNTHLTGDPKYISLWECNNCGYGAIQIYLCANTWSGENNLEFRIDITTEEREKFDNLMSKCPDTDNESCVCPVHRELDIFEMSEVSRREVLLDEYIPW